MYWLLLWLVCTWAAFSAFSCQVSPLMALHSPDVYTWDTECWDNGFVHWIMCCWIMTNCFPKWMLQCVPSWEIRVSLAAFHCQNSLQWNVTTFSIRSYERASHHGLICIPLFIGGITLSSSSLAIWAPFLVECLGGVQVFCPFRLQSHLHFKSYVAEVLVFCLLPTNYLVQKYHYKSPFHFWSVSFPLFCCFFLYGVCFPHTHSLIYNPKLPFPAFHMEVSCKVKFVLGTMWWRDRFFFQLYDKPP